MLKVSAECVYITSLSLVFCLPAYFMSYFCAAATFYFIFFIFENAFVQQVQLFLPPRKVSFAFLIWSQSAVGLTPRATQRFSCGADCGLIWWLIWPWNVETHNYRGDNQTGLKLSLKFEKVGETVGRLLWFYIPSDTQLLHYWELLAYMARGFWHLVSGFYVCCLFFNITVQQRSNIRESNCSLLVCDI